MLPSALVAGSFSLCCHQAMPRSRAHHLVQRLITLGVGLPWACLPSAVFSFGPDLGLRGSYQLSRHRLDLCLPPGRGGSRRPCSLACGCACRLVSPASALAACGSVYLVDLTIQLGRIVLVILGTFPVCRTGYSPDHHDVLCSLCTCLLQRHNRLWTPRTVSKRVGVPVQII